MDSPRPWALWIDALDLRDGERVVHIGCGLGYYSAILAEVVGADGHVTALEIDPALAARARRNLAHLPHVEVRETDGASCDLDPADAASPPRRETDPAVLSVCGG